MTGPSLHSDSDLLDAETENLYLCSDQGCGSVFLLYTDPYLDPEVLNSKFSTRKLKSSLIIVSL
jgi:hypothetical protein